jgi:U4/U6 small nuclear ribonucleoprotein PRP4
MSANIINSNTADASQLEVVSLTVDSQREKEQQDAMLLELEAKKRAFAVSVPTLPHDITAALRQLGQPTQLFGEEPADIRSRLRMILARKSVLEDPSIDTSDALKVVVSQQRQLDVLGGGRDVKEEPGEEDAATRSQGTTYTHATPELIEAREEIFHFSMQRAKRRLISERERRAARRRLTTTNNDEADKDKHEDKDEGELSILGKKLKEQDQNCGTLFEHAKRVGLEGSQFGDPRSLSCVCALPPLSGATKNSHALVATGGWSGTLKVWDAAKGLGLKASKPLAHQDRIMGIAASPLVHSNGERYLCTTSIDLTAKLWKLSLGNTTLNNDEMQIDGKNVDSNDIKLEETGILRGHEARLCRAAFHPNGRQVLTTSFDTSWRMWDVETSKELLLQDGGHDKETFGVGIHPDGSLVAITDFAGVIRLWDLRSGKAVHHFAGQHAKRVLCAEFHPSCGFQLSTAGDDGTLRVWDIRQRSLTATIPAHSKLITQLRYLTHESNSISTGEVLASSSFDSTVRTWSTRDWKMLSSLEGHEGKIAGVDFVRPSPQQGNNLGRQFNLVTCGFDKTLKLWK